MTTKINTTPKAPAVAPKVDTNTTFLESLKTLSDAQLKTVVKAVREEVKSRVDALHSVQAKVGDKVRILKGRYEGKVGEVIISRKLRAFVRIPGEKHEAYELHTNVEKVS